MVERFHHQLKAALKTQWSMILTIVKNTLPGSFSFINKMRTYFRNIQITKPQITQNFYRVPYALVTASHVFILHDAILKPLQSLYNGPYRVVKYTDKHYTGSINEWEQIISIECLKPAHIDSNSSEQSDLTILSTSPFSLKSKLIINIYSLCLIKEWWVKKCVHYIVTSSVSHAVREIIGKTNTMAISSGHVGLICTP